MIDQSKNEDGCWLEAKQLLRTVTVELVRVTCLGPALDANDPNGIGHGGAGRYYDLKNSLPRPQEVQRFKDPKDTIVCPQGV